MRYFASWPSYPYHFVTDDARKRYQRVVCTPKKAVVLTELRAELSRYVDVSQLDCVPRSKYEPGMLVEPCRKYEMGGRTPAVNWSAYREAVKRVRSKFRRKARCSPIPLEDVPFDGTKNSGLPYLIKKADDYESALERARQCQAGKCPPPMIMFSRGKNLKVCRPVMAGPFEWQLIEGRFFYPLQDLLLSHDSPYCAGVPSMTVQARVNQLAYSPWVLEMDYSGFDGSLSGLLIGSGFSILRGAMDLNTEEAALWNRIQEYFVTSPIVAPDLRCYTGRKHGVPSGSLFTQMIDSVCNAIILEYVAIRLHMDLERYIVLGDDSLSGFSNPVTIDEIADTAGEIGITVNRTKSRIVDPNRQKPHFLGHDLVEGFGERSARDTFERLLTPERLNREMFSKDRNVRYRYYLERVRAYQEDNANSRVWAILRLVECRLADPQMNEMAVRRKARDSDMHVFRPAEVVERDRWDQQRRLLRSQVGRAPRRALVYWT